MRILIDIGHPAHVHLFRFFAQEMLAKGNEILFTCRDKEYEIYLLETFRFPYKSFGKKYSSPVGKLWGLLEFDIKEFFSGLKFRPDIFLSHGSIYAAHASYLLGKPHISLEDTFNIEQVRLYKPFTQAILTSDYNHPLKSYKVIRYSGYHELAYLHPRRFTPDKSILNDLGIKENEKFIIIRFVSWNASHDIGHKGISLINKIRAVKEFSQYSKVFISSESELPSELSGYKIDIPPQKMHDALAYATLLWAESFTMPAECSVLGTPSIIIHNSMAFSLQEQQVNYGLCFKYSESEEDQQRAIKKGLELLNILGLRDEWHLRRDRMLSEKIDVTAFLIWFVEQWPESFKIMKENPEYQERFK